MKIYSYSVMLIIVYFSYNISSAQKININSSFSAEQLIEENFIEGCVEVSNIKSTVNGSVNNINSFAYFEKANSNFPFTNGIMLSTGNATSGGNNLNNETLNEGESNWGTDPDLENALGITGTLNATSIEFDFISASNQIQFNYILASEEYYGDFPCQYSDGFAFLIKEFEGINDYQNIALIPNTSIAVNTNTIHNEIVGFCEAQNNQHFEGYNVGDTNFNGRTKVLSATATIKPNTKYRIKLIIADQTDENYDSAVFIEGNSFNATVDLGPDIQTCAASINLDGDIQNPDATYTWFFNDNLINGAVSPIININESGTYKVMIEMPISDFTCAIEDTIIVDISETQSVDILPDYIVCDDALNDQIATFDLPTKDADVLNAVTNGNYSITYHQTYDDSISNLNAIDTSIGFNNNTNPQNIFVRILDNDNGCLAYSNFNLIVNTSPQINTPSTLSICDDGIGDGITNINLSDKNDEIIGQQTDLNITYHATEEDADNNENPLSIPYRNSSRAETLFVRVENTNTGCYNKTILNISVEANPALNRSYKHYLDSCENDEDGFASFDLTLITPDILNGLTGVTTTFHLTNNEALNGTNPIQDEENFQNTSLNEQTIYVRVTNDTTGCASVLPVEIHTSLLKSATNTASISICDTGNDLNEGIDLENAIVTITDNISFINVTFYESENDRDNEINAIDVTQTYTVNSASKLLYMTLKTPTCTEFETIEFILTPTVDFQSVGTLDYCDTNQNGFININLRTFDDQITNNLPNYTVTYFITEEDAINNTNNLGSFYTNNVNPQTFYTRITKSPEGCFDINSFKVHVLPAPVTTKPSPIIACDIDGDMQTIVNLTEKIPEIVNTTNNVNISFHINAVDAGNNSSPIINTASYMTNSKIVYVRVENPITGCYTIEELDILINSLPVFTEIKTYKVCKAPGAINDGFDDFILSTKDSEILNGQTNKEVFYFLTQNDADNKTNSINKDEVYRNITNPQTIYTRVENINDQSCYNTASFEIEVGIRPPFNKPVDWFVCDDISNDGISFFDLNVIEQQIIDGIPESLDVTFHTSLDDAENGTNPIPKEFHNTTNPQQIFVQIDNGNICTSITSFELNVIHVPDIRKPEPLIVCDDGFNDKNIFDLTTSLPHILDVRQDNLEVTYYTSINDLETNTNPINTPKTFETLNTLETVYVKVSNTISNCYAYTTLDLIVSPIPEINDFKTYEGCNVGYVNLEEINPIIMDNSTNITFNYYETEVDAINNTNALNYHYNYTALSTNLYARVELTDTKCFVVYPFQLLINPLPIANKPPNLVTCDDNFDGLIEYDLSQQDTVILGNQDPNNFTVSYFNDIDFAHLNIEALNNIYNAFDGEAIYARVENNTTGCYEVTSFNTTINPLPDVVIPDQVICLEKLPLIVNAGSTDNNYTYFWSTNETTPEIIISEIGTYSVTITSPHGCEITQTFNVDVSEQATIETTETVDFSDPNNITITVSGIGSYLFALDDNEPQEDNVFRNVSIGDHTIRIIDINGCSEAIKHVIVMDTPKFFTPNNDGYFDTWHITGVKNLPGTVINIFDRYGKQLASLTSKSPGWDGKLNGVYMPVDDYWFRADVHYKDNTRFELKGHFTLKR